MSQKLKDADWECVEKPRRGKMLIAPDGNPGIKVNDLIILAGFLPCGCKKPDKINFDFKLSNK